MGERLTLEFVLNGRGERIEASSHWTLLQVLRDGLGLLGTKEGCGEGSCGSCTVLVDGGPVRACLTIAPRIEGRRVDTIDGLAAGAELHPLQREFAERGAVQCGFCTPGFIMTALALLEELEDPSDEQIREYLSGNFCRCGGYTMILDAVQAVAKGSSS